MIVSYVKHIHFFYLDYQKLVQEIRNTLLKIAESISIQFDWKESEYEEIILNTKEQIKIYRDF